ncbi:MAG: DegT/DnrJ/EryC1/StrS family aminotransferase, partial [Gemmatimonadales bacterium]
MRAQLPVWSPISARILASGLARAAGSDPLGLLEARLAAEYRAQSVVLTDGGTSALTLALRSLGPAPVVGLPAYGCFDLATAAVGANATLRFYDVDPASLAPDDASLRQILAAGVDGVVFVHFYGVPVDLRRWRDSVRSAGAVVIDDAAQGAGA